MEWKKKLWYPENDVSLVDDAYHNAVVDAPYYIDSLDALVELIVPEIKANDIVVDYGAGTGISAIRLLKHLELEIQLILVDINDAWLRKAIELLSYHHFVGFLLLGKQHGHYERLNQVIGSNLVDHVISANTLHLLQNTENILRGIHSSLRADGSFCFNSANIYRTNNQPGLLILNDAIQRIRDIALEIVRSDPTSLKRIFCRNSMAKRIRTLRNGIFPEPKSIYYYCEMLKKIGFSHIKCDFKSYNIGYSHWMDFMKIKKIQIGVLPEITNKEIRNVIVQTATEQFIEEHKHEKTESASNGFLMEFAYVKAYK